MRTEKEIKEKIACFRKECRIYNHNVGGAHHDVDCAAASGAHWLEWVLE